MVASDEDAAGLALNQRPNVFIVCVGRTIARLRLAHDGVRCERCQQRIDFSFTQPVQRPHLLAEQNFPVPGKQRS